MCDSDSLPLAFFLWSHECISTSGTCNSSSGHRKGHLMMGLPAEWLGLFWLLDKFLGSQSCLIAMALACEMCTGGASYFDVCFTIFCFVIRYILYQRPAEQTCEPDLSWRAGLHTVCFKHCIWNSSYCLGACDMIPSATAATALFASSRRPVPFSVTSWYCGGSWGFCHHQRPTWTSWPWTHLRWVNVTSYTPCAGLPASALALMSAG